MKLKSIIFSFLFLIILIRLSFAEPGVKITQPQDNSIVNPGQQITVRVEAVDGFVVNYGTVGVSNLSIERFSSLPITFTVTIPLESSGIIPVWVIAKDVSKNEGGETITLNVQQTATLQSLEINQNEISVNLDWDGNIKKEDNSGYIITTYGLYSDGIKREIPREELTYTSSDPSVISIDNKGNYEINKVGDANITVSYSGVNKVIPVIFRKPTGIKPLETIPPTTQIEIQPPANSAGWHNQDITITITAQDNEGGSGIAEINYQWYNMSGKLEYVQGDSAVLYLTKEGRNHLRYYAVDKERNEEKESHDIEFKLDKTPPQTTCSISPLPNEGGWHNRLPVKVSFKATDNLSGIAFTTEPVSLTTDGIHNINYHSTDVADNVEETKALTVKIDTTLPEIKLNISPNILWPPDHKMVDVKINGTTTDTLSGVTSTTFKATDEYAQVEPAISKFGDTIQLEAWRKGDDLNGRTYIISVTAIDFVGNKSTVSKTVTVPHDMRN